MPMSYCNRDIFMHFYKTHIPYVLFLIYTDMHIDVYTDIHVDVYTDIHVNVYTDVHIDVYTPALLPCRCIFVGYIPCILYFIYSYVHSMYKYHIYRHMYTVLIHMIHMYTYTYRHCVCA